MPNPNNGITIISTAADGTQGNLDSGGIGGGSGGFDNSNSFSISADGTKIAFNSDASNLVPGDTNGYTDVFVKDLTTGAIVLASTLTGSDVGRSLEPTISPDGTKVAFVTTPFNNGSPFGTPQVFIKDLVTGTVTLAVTDSQGAKLAQDIVSSPVFSPDGTKLAFYTTADLTGVGTSRAGGLYIKDLGSRAVTLVSAAAPGKPGNGSSGEPVFSPDGTKIAFVSNSTNLGPTAKLGNSADVYVKDLVTGAVTLVSADAAGQRHGTIYNVLVDSTNPAFSPDGTKVAFQSTANDLVPGDEDNGSDIFIKDLATGAITRVTALADGTSEGGYGPAFSPDGTKIAFWTFATGYSPFPHPGGTSIYIKDLVTGAFTLASPPANPANQGIGNSQDPQFSPDGSKLLFWSTNEALVATDANGNKADIFVKSLSALPPAPPVAVPDSYTTAQGTPLTVAAMAGLLANDTDPNGKPLTALLADNPAHGALTLNVDGSFTYTPAAGYRGSDAFTYQASDGTALSTAATVSITVTPVDHPVTANNDSYAVSNGSPASDFTTTAAAGVLANDVAPDGGLVALGIVVGGTVQTGFVRTAAGGQAQVLSDGRLVYRQPFSSDAFGLIRYNGLDSFTYRARDSDGSTADATVTLTVGEGVNHPVFATDDSYSVPPVGNLTTGTSNGVLANDYSPDMGLVALGIVVGGTVQTGFVSTAAGGQAEVLSDGRVVYNQPASSDAFGPIRYVGLDSFTYRVRDSDGSTADATVTLSVGGGVNHPVIAVDDTYSVSSPIFTTGTSNGVLANDFSLDMGLVALGIVVNGAVQTGFVRTAAGGQAEVFSDGRITYNQPASSDAFGPIRYVGLDSFTYRVRDGDGSTADATVTLSVGGGVNHPVFATDDSYSVSNAFPASDFATDITAGLLANDYAPDGGLVALGVVVGGAVQTGFVRTAAGGQVNVAPDGRLTYRQPFSTDAQSLIRYNGIDSFTYRVRDGDGSTADATVTLTVGSGVNHPVTATDDTYAVSNAFPSAAFTTDVATGVLANDTSPDGGLVVLGIVVDGVLQTGSVRTAAGGSATLSSDGRLTYNQPFSTDAQSLIRYNGIDSFTYRVRDADGSTADATVTLTVGSGVNHPVTATDDSYAVPNAFPASAFTTTAATGVLANDTSPDGGLVVLGVVVGGTVQTGFVRTAAGGSATLSSDGRLTYNQPFSTDAQSLIRYNGLDSFTYRVRDADGSTADATVTLTVGTGVNHPVTARDDSYAVSNAFPASDFTVTAATGLLANDTSPDGGLVALGIVAGGVMQTGFVHTAAGGSVNLAPDGRFTYDQPFSTDALGLIRYNGLDSFTYRVRDADGSTADATVTLTVGSGVNNPVTAHDDSYAVPNAFPASDFSVTAAAGLLANDAAPDGGLVALGIVVNGAVQTGSVRTTAGGMATVFSDGRLTYDQPFSTDALGLIRYNGLDSFTYRVRDSDGSTADATVTLTIGSGVNHPVTATDDSYAVPNTFPAADFTTDVATGVLANDTSPDGGLVALGVVVGGTVQTGFVRTAAGGQVNVAPDGRLTYDQPFGTDAQGLVRYNGLDSFTYRVRDADGSTADATVTLTVGTGGNHPPVAAPDTLSVAAHAAATGNLLANDSDPDAGDVPVLTAIQFSGGQPIAVAPGGSATLAGQHGTLIVGSDGRYTYAGSLAGIDPFTYTLTDGHGGKASASVTATVTPGAPPPADATFAFGFLQSTVSYAGRQAFITGPDGVANDVTGIGHLHFTDGTIDEADGAPLVDDLFYDALNKDVYAAHVDPDAHYAASGFLEGRDPNALFSTTGYLAANPDVQAAGVNPLQHYDQNGWREGRDASPAFSSKSYLAQNPDVAAAGIDPLAHYLANGQAEGRSALPGTDANGIAGAFDTSYYLAQNPDVKAAGIDPLLHFLVNGWHEGRNPDAYFSTSAYLSANPDVAAAGIDPLIHYDVYGWTEGRPTSGFNTQGYLAANPDIAAARIDPLQHYLQIGIAEGRHGWEL